MSGYEFVSVLAFFFLLGSIALTALGLNRPDVVKAVLAALSNWFPKK
jgi:hypothetical protein